MTNPLSFDALKDILPRQLAHLPDHRTKGPNTRYAISEAVLGAFASFLPNRYRFWSTNAGCNTARHNNIQTLLGV